jgi:hypothetical protein
MFPAGSLGKPLLAFDSNELNKSVPELDAGVTSVAEWFVC